MTNTRGCTKDDARRCLAEIAGRSGGGQCMRPRKFGHLCVTHAKSFWLKSRKQFK